MVVPVALGMKQDRGQSAAEFAIVLPALTFLILACLQAGMLGYASIVARYAVFRGLHAAAVVKPLERERTARLAALAAVASAPGLTLAGIEVREASVRFPPEAARAIRLELAVRVGAPRLVPVRTSWCAEGRAVLPMEPVWQ